MFDSVLFRQQKNNSLSLRERTKGHNKFLSSPRLGERIGGEADGVARGQGFTLAEVLITLGIIGVVAAMTIPSLMQKNFEKKVVSQLTETQSILTQAIRMAEEEYGDVEGWGLVMNEVSAMKIYDNLKYFLKVGVDCGTRDLEFKCVAKNYKYLNGASTVSYSEEAYKYKILLLNGSSVMVQAISNIGLQFNIDVNGPGKPNVMGKDLFLFQYYDKGVYPMGAPGTLYDYKTNCRKGANGLGCAYYVLNFKNMNYLH